jgi:cold shock CspA family protein/ribosome-associated translation inhibitor RaiA
MKFPFKLQFRDIARDERIYNAVWDHVDKLERIYQRIVSCEVTVAAPHRHKKGGVIYHIQIRLYVPGEDIFVTTEPERDGAHKDVYVAIRDAFDSAQRKLEDLVRRERSFVKVKVSPSEGKVIRIFPNEHCGFILSQDQREIYFHENSVLNNNFDRLKIGDRVRFSEEMGEKGPQVTSLQKAGAS